MTLSCREWCGVSFANGAKRMKLSSEFASFRSNQHEFRTNLHRTLSNSLSYCIVLIQ